MNRSIAQQKGGSFLIVGAILIILCLAQAKSSFARGTNQQSASYPGDPPSAPAELFQGIKDTSNTAGSSCTRPNCIFLPSLFNSSTNQPLDKATALSLYQNYYLPGNNVAAGWNGNVGSCNPGTTSSAYKEAILKRINFFRLAAGIPPLISLNTTYNGKAQAAALMMSRAGALSHYPDSSWPCYTSAGDEAAGSSNLYLGRSGPDAISGYVRDPGSGNSAVGHRRWILLPQTQQMGTGDIPPGSGYSQANALWVFDGHTWDPRPETRNPYVAWPPTGSIPYQVVYARWSFAYPNADFSQAKASMRKNGSPVGVTRYNSVNGYGENTLVWIISGMGDGDIWPKPAQDETYFVTITGVIIGGQSKNFEYPVTIFDPNE